MPRLAYCSPVLFTERAVAAGYAGAPVLGAAVLWPLDPTAEAMQHQSAVYLPAYSRRCSST